jgi:prepilin-type processing-associated H-X9-DG protein
METPEVPQCKPRDRWMYILLGVLAVGLFLSRPIANPSLTGSELGTANCLVNLQNIGVAYAMYARDYDGKFPRGVDPEDRYNSTIWQESEEYGALYYPDSQSAPFLHQILLPYVSGPEVFHCPDDDGWVKSRLAPMTRSSLMNVKPSSFARYGTSYYCYTILGFSNVTAADLEAPAASLVLFDGDYWHGNPRDSINGLFADGHAANLNEAEFRRYSQEP